MSFQSLGNILPNRLKHHGVSEEVGAAVVCQAFDQVIQTMGGPLVGAVRAVQFNKGNLVVMANSSAAASALQIKASLLAEQANHQLGHNAIKQVRIRVGAG